MFSAVSALNEKSAFARNEFGIFSSTIWLLISEDPVNEIRDLVLKASDPSEALFERQTAFEKLVARFQDMAYASAYARLGDCHLAEDAAQRAFVAAWQKLSQLREPEAFPGWFKRVVHTECNRISRGKKFGHVPIDHAVNLASSVEDPQVFIERAELEQALFRSIEELSEAERTVITLFYLREQSHRDISAFLEVAITTVAKRLHSAKHRLRGKMMARFKADIRKHQPSRDPRFCAKVKAGIYDEYVGRYQFESRPELVVTIVRQGDNLISEGGGQRNILFALRGRKNELAVTEFDGRGEFIRDERGSITHVDYYESGHLMGRARKMS